MAYSKKPPGGAAVLLGNQHELPDDLLRGLAFREIPTFPERRLPTLTPLSLDAAEWAGNRLRLAEFYGKSPYYLSAPAAPRYIERYSDRFVHRSGGGGAPAGGGKTLGQFCPFDERYFPAELCTAVVAGENARGAAAQARSAQAPGQRRESDLSLRLVLEQAERDDQSGQASAPIMVNEDDEDAEHAAVPDEDDFDEDLEGEYIQDYYDEEFDPFADNDDSDAM